MDKITMQAAAYETIRNAVMEFVNNDEMMPVSEMLYKAVGIIEFVDFQVGNKPVDAITLI